MKRTWLWAFASGLLFSVALGLGGMTLPRRIIGFLDVGGHWDPTLLGFMAGAVGVFMVFYRVGLARRRAWSGAVLAPRPDGRIDGRLLAGAALFGLGWGLAGYCPAPAVTSLVTGSGGVAVFVLTMLGGMGAHGALERWRSRPRQPSAAAASEPAPRGGQVTEPAMSAPSCG